MQNEYGILVIITRPRHNQGRVLLYMSEKYAVTSFVACPHELVRICNNKLYRVSRQGDIIVINHLITSYTISLEAPLIYAHDNLR